MNPLNAFFSMEINYSIFINFYRNIYLVSLSFCIISPLRIKIIFTNMNTFNIFNIEFQDVINGFSQTRFHELLTPTNINDFLIICLISFHIKKREKFTRIAKITCQISVKIDTNHFYTL